jgi:hypothetical protein
MAREVCNFFRTGHLPVIASRHLRARNRWEEEKQVAVN